MLKVFSYNSVVDEDIVVVFLCPYVVLRCACDLTLQSNIS